MGGLLVILEKSSLSRITKSNYLMDLKKQHDGVTPDGKKVQIKTTMKSSLTFPCDHTPDYYLGIKIFPDGTYEEIFNGSGNIARKGILNRKPAKNNLHSISLSALRTLNDTVPENDRIARRQNQWPLVVPWVAPAPEHPEQLAKTVRWVAFNSFL